MTTYKGLYYYLVRSVSLALDELEARHTVTAIYVLKDALLRAEELVIETDIVPEE